jgi:cytochrome c-type biogenesis protein
MTDDLTFALLAGMLATVNPCGFAMLPGYLALVVAGDSRGARVGRALLASGLMTVGFVVVFGIFGLVSAPTAEVLQLEAPIVTIVVGALLVIMGGLLLTGKEMFLLLPKPKRGAPTTRVTSMLGYGVAFAIASLSCSIGPFLAAAGIALRRGDPFAYLTYAVGMGLVVAVLAIAAALASTVLAEKARGLLRYVGRVGGALLVLTGVYVGYYGLYELRLYQGGDPSDPVIDLAARVPGVLSEWLRALGPTALVIALIVLVGAVVVVRRRRSSPSPSPHRSAPEAAPRSPARHPASG